MADNFLGEIRMFGGNFAPQNWALCNGQLLSLAQYQALFALIGTTYGGNGVQNFALPDLRCRIPLGQGQGPGLSNYVLGQPGGVEGVTILLSNLPNHAHSMNASPTPATSQTVGSTVMPAKPNTAGNKFFTIPGSKAPTIEHLSAGSCGLTGGSQPHSNLMPSLCVTFISPFRAFSQAAIEVRERNHMSNAYIGEIRAFGFNFATRGWAMCNGQVVPISQNTALFSVIGTTFGGDGVTTFGLPDMRDRAPMDWGNGPGLTPRTIGETLGTATVTLTTQQIPGHNHMLVTAGAAATDSETDTPANNAWLGLSVGGQMYTDNAATPNVAFAANAIGNNGGSQPHNNVQPLLTLNFCIALEGIFPSRN